MIADLGFPSRDARSLCSLANRNEQSRPRSGAAADLEGAKSVLGYVFTDPELGQTALQPWRHSFSRLDFLGDSVLGLTIFTLAEVSGAPRDHAK